MVRNVQVPKPPADVGKASPFALLDAVDADSGSIDHAALPAPEPAAPPRAQEAQAARLAPVRSLTPAAAAAAAPTDATAVYRAFQQLSGHPKTEVCLRFHKTNVVRIRPSGELMLDSGGWHTAMTVAAINDALHAAGLDLSYAGDVAEGRWFVVDDLGRRYTFADRMVLPADQPQHKGRAQAVWDAYHGGAEVPRYVPHPPAAQQQQRAQPQPRAPAPAAAAAARPGAQPAAAARAAQAPRAQPQPLPFAAADGQQAAAQIAAAAQAMGLQDDIDDSHECVVCMERARAVVLVPCGHMVLCRECTPSVTAQGFCPVCREPIVDHATINAAE